MAWLESRAVIHRDLALRNVLVFEGEPLLCKLADFGCKDRHLGCYLGERLCHYAVHSIASYDGRDGLLSRPLA